ncbi:cyanophycin synthetase [Tateyamaria pelophila]|uniref:cyanophycin synthetase n=1 Tax=Tateyamaria pelophila TaxID=328415 RepID=UPI001CC07C78|nr:cyanophycin synthetase [Tateyamaria pelophila]
MKVLEHRALRGPNRYSRYQAIFMLLDIGAYEQQPSDTIDGFTDRLIALIPTLHNHGCSVGGPGGFIQRLRRGTWIGHIAEHVALELQCLAGMEVGFGKTYDTNDDGIYKVVYRYRVESAGLKAGEDAVALVQAMAENRPYDIDAVIAHLKDLRESDLLGPSTNSIVEEAKHRGIPAIRLNSDSHVQLGYGAKQRHIQATMTDRTSAIGVEIADEKFRTKERLSRAGIPTPDGRVATSLGQATGIADDLGYPVAVKPEIGNHGRGISARVSDASELATAFVSAVAICSSVIVEKTMTGFDFRVLVIDGNLVAAARREPAHIVGDGTSTVQQLINHVNADPRRGIGHERVLTAISIDHMSQRLLAFQDRTLDDVLASGEKLYLKSTANLSTGGTACDVTDHVHQDARLMCERVARIIGMDCIGIDIVAPGLDQPLSHGSAGIVEVNAAPGFRMHLAPTEGQARNVAKPFVDMLFPPALDTHVPIIAVTGTNGKTTTAKLIAHTLKYSGHMVGFAGTTGVAIDGVEIVAGDYSGPEGSSIVLREPTIDHAVLEIARGGIIRRGLGFDTCDVGVFLNVGEDHIGTDGVEDLEELSLVKATVIEVVKDTGVSVLNADDPIVVGLAGRAGGKIIYFSLQPKNETIRQHLSTGGTAVVLQDGNLVIHSPEPTIHVSSVLEAPITMSGAAIFNIANVLAGVAALHGLGLSVDMIRNGISTFHPSASQNPGRMNLIDFVTFKVIVDYGHNTPAVQAMGHVLPHLTKGQKIVVAHGTGSRVDTQLRAFGLALSEVYDKIILADADPRGRKPGATSELVRSGAVDNGFAPGAVDIINNPDTALARAFEIVQPGDLIVVQVNEVEPMLRAVMAHFARIAGPARLPEAVP